MTAKENFEQLIKELGTLLGIENLKQDEFGMIMLEVDKKLPLYLTFSEGRESVLFTCELATAPVDAPAKVFRTLLEAQLFEQGTGGGHFALDDNGIITFHLELLLDNTPATTFNETLESFINICAHWQNSINDMLTETGSTTEQKVAPEEDANLLRV